jgi:hypothetical protein
VRNRRVWPSKSGRGNGFLGGRDSGVEKARSLTQREISQCGANSAQLAVVGGELERAIERVGNSAAAVRKQLGALKRLGEVAKGAGVTFRWRPFANVRALTGATEVPFPDGASKTRHMWRDIERRAAMYGIPLRLPIPYPISNSRATNCVALGACKRVGANGLYVPRIVVGSNTAKRMVVH